MRRKWSRLRLRRATQDSIRSAFAGSTVSRRPYFDSVAMKATLFTLGGLRHAGDVETPRRMERVSLDDMRERFEHQGGAIRKVVHGALHLIFWSERGRMPPEKGLRV